MEAPHRSFPRSAVALILLVALRLTHAADKSPTRWEHDVQSFEAADRTNAPPKGGIVFVGSSSIRLWRTLAEDFKGIPVINRGFGGSEMEDSAYYADRLVLAYQPRQVLVYAGDNDLAGGKAPERILSDFKAFVAKVHQARPETRIDYIAVKPSPSRWHLAEQVRQTNRLIADYTKTDKRLGFIDVFTAMLAEDGKPREDLFVADRLHMNAKGYAIWTSLVRPVLLR